MADAKREPIIGVPLIAIVGASAEPECRGHLFWIPVTGRVVKFGIVGQVPRACAGDQVPIQRWSRD